MKGNHSRASRIGRWGLLLAVSCALAVFMAVAPGAGLADPLYIGLSGSQGQTIAGSGVDFSCVGSSCAPVLVNDSNDLYFNSTYNAFVHNDQNPWKGVATIQVKNTGSQSWSDFHFQIFSLYTPSNPGGWSNPADVFFDISGSNYPTYTNSANGSYTLPPDSVDVTPASGSNGAMLDLYFNAAPVAVGQTATFTLYTDNTEDQGLFGLVMYPSAEETTPVTIPGTLLLLGPGLASVIAFSRRHAS